MGTDPGVAGMEEVAWLQSGVIQMWPGWDRSPSRCEPGIGGGASPAVPVGVAWSPAHRDVTRVLIPTVSRGNGPSAPPPTASPNPALVLVKFAVNQRCASLSLVARHSSPAPLPCLCPALGGAAAIAPGLAGPEGAPGVSGATAGGSGHPGVQSGPGRGVGLWVGGVWIWKEV